jgi:hypothetical protein
MYTNLKRQLQNTDLLFKHSLLSTQYFFFKTFSIEQRDTEDHICDHRATREVFLNQSFSSAGFIYRNLLYRPGGFYYFSLFSNQ